LREDAETQQTEPADDQSSRLERIARRVRTIGAHFGIWIDGDGEHCRVIDERGQGVAHESMAALVVREVLMAQAEPKIILPPRLAAIIPAAQQAGVEVIQASGTRQAIWRAMREHRAHLATDANGRFWFVDEPTCADALKLLTVLLTLLSRGDRPLSELIASAIL
jgi:phosphomannomutase